MKKILLIFIVILILGLMPVWKKNVKRGEIKINSYTKIQLYLGLIKID